MKTKYLTAAVGMLFLLSGCAATKPAPKQHEVVLSRHDAALARIEFELAKLRNYLAGSEKHQDDALVQVFDRLAQVEGLLNQHATQLNRVQVRSHNDYWVATPKKPVQLPGM